MTIVYVDDAEMDELSAIICFVVVITQTIKKKHVTKTYLVAHKGGRILVVVVVFFVLFNNS